jgi:DNA-directed RNA polymerase specialized sigma24 family protein
MKPAGLGSEAVALLSYLEGRGLSQREACAVMGIGISSLMTHKSEARDFAELLIKSVSRAKAQPYHRASGSEPKAPAS